MILMCMCRPPPGPGRPPIHPRTTTTPSSATANVSRPVSDLDSALRFFSFFIHFLYLVLFIEGRVAANPSSMMFSSSSSSSPSSSSLIKLISGSSSSQQQSLGKVCERWAVGKISHRWWQWWTWSWWRWRWSSGDKKNDQIKEVDLTSNAGGGEGERSSWKEFEQVHFFTIIIQIHH